MPYGFGSLAILLRQVSTLRHTQTLNARIRKFLETTHTLLGVSLGNVEGFGSQIKLIRAEAYSGFVDFFLAVFPATQFWSLQMPLRRKIILSIMLGLGLV